MRKHRYKGLMDTIQDNICGDGYDADVRADEIFEKAKRKIDKAYQQGRKDVIDECIKEISKLDSGSDYGVVYPSTVCNILEMLKKK